jgi:hypothetical protein
MAFLEYHKEGIQAKWLYTTLVQNDHLKHELMYLFPFEDASSAAKHNNKVKIIIHRVTETKKSTDIPNVKKDLPCHTSLNTRKLQNPKFLITTAKESHVIRRLPIPPRQEILARILDDT